MPQVGDGPLTIGPGGPPLAFPIQETAGVRFTGSSKPVFTFMFSPATNPLDSAAYVDITPYVLDFQCKYGRQFELNRFEAGTAQFTLDNTDRRFDPVNTSSPYYPNLLPMRKFRVTATFQGVTYTIFIGYIEQWPPAWEGPSWSTVECTAIDAFEALSLADISSLPATLTTTQGSNKDLKFTSNALGAGNNLITIEYVNTGSLTVTVTGLAIQVGINQGTTTANQILSAVNADTIAGILVTASLASGSTGTGTPTAFASTALTGGTFQQQLTGARINAVLDAVNWPSTDRAIDAGQVQVAARMFKVSDHQKAKSHINDVENSELGYVFINHAAGGVITYHDKVHRTTASRSTVSQATFGDGGGSELEYEELQPSYDKTYVYNYVAVTPYGASVAQTATDQMSISQYMLRTYTLSTELTSSSDALSLAANILNTYKQPQLRFVSMTIKPLDDANIWSKALTLQIGDRITVIRRPPTNGQVIGSQMSNDSFIESIEWQMSGGELDVTVKYELSPTLGALQLLLDDPIFGKLDSNNVLGAF